MESRRRLGATKRVLVREIELRRGTLQCPGCEAPFEPERLTKHHIRPRSRGGPTTVENLVLICRACHDAVHRKKPRRQDRIRRAKLRRFLHERANGEFPPPPPALTPEEGLQLFFHRVSVRIARASAHARFLANPPFDPYWPIARAFPGRQQALAPAIAGA